MQIHHVHLLEVDLGGQDLHDRQEVEHETVACNVSLVDLKQINAKSGIRA